ncbi:hypothetical protein ACR777_20135 [Sphingobacterium spiritivorum]
MSKQEKKGKPTSINKVTEAKVYIEKSQIQATRNPPPKPKEK